MAVEDATFAHHVIGHNQPARPDQRQRELEIGGIVVFVGIDKYQIERCNTFRRQKLEVVDTGAHTHVRVTNLVFPHGFVIPMSSEMTITQWHVPIDDHRHYWYAIFTSFGAPVNKD